MSDECPSSSSRRTSRVLGRSSSSMRSIDRAVFRARGLAPSSTCDARRGVVRSPVESVARSAAVDRMRGGTDTRTVHELLYARNTPYLSY